MSQESYETTEENTDAPIVADGSDLTVSEDSLVDDAATSVNDSDPTDNEPTDIAKPDAETGDGDSDDADDSETPTEEDPSRSFVVSSTHFPGSGT